MMTKKALRAPLAFLFALGLAAAASATVYAEAAAQESFTFVQMGDPQLGFGGLQEDRERFADAVEQINSLHPDFVVICGDLVNRPDQSFFADFNQLKSKFTIPCYCAPGNHDVGNTPKPRLLKQYRDLVGKDYFSFEHKGCTFVIANTQLWKEPLAEESEKHDTWFRETLETAARKKQPIFVVMHYPLFIKEPNEPDNYYNLPLEKRKELLALFERCGVVALLSGHTHTTLIHEVSGIQMVTSQTTCKNFDKQPFGFRLWHVGVSRPYQNEFVPLRNQTTLRTGEQLGK